jgi:uncharacterized membrane protein YozB (DUF420 family)
MSSIFLAYAPSTSNEVLVVELAIGVLLVAGAVMVRLGHVRVHKWMQACLVLVNVPIVLSWMVPEYLKWVWPGLPRYLGQEFYYVPTLMLIFGIAAEVLGVWILLVAGTNWLPERARFRRYKLWMRTELALWWGVLLLGVATYYVWYSPT